MVKCLMLEHSHLPEANRLSVLAAAILLAYALARFVDIPVRQLAMQLPGVYLEIQIDIQTVIALIVAGLTATGADWLLRTHPGMQSQSILEHWFLPALTAWVIGLPLFQLPLGLQWWAGFGLGGILLMLVLVAEYITIDPDDIRQPAAAAGLIALSFALFLTMAVSLRFGSARLFLILPAILVAAGMVSLRSLNLRLHGRWAFLQASLVALICAQLAAALHYLPISPVSFGLALIAPAYAITSLTASLIEGEPIRKAVGEPAVILTVLLAAAVWLR
jgi:hypothetical protein